MADEPIAFAFPKPSGRVRDAAYLGMVVRLPCCSPWAPRWCEGRTEADHAGRRPLGRKSDDREAIPLCSRCHRARTDLRGPFAGWPADRMRAWLDERIAETLTAVERLGRVEAA